MRHGRESFAPAVATLLACAVAGCTPKAPATGEREAGDSRVVAPVAQVETLDTWLDLLAQRPSAITGVRGRVLVDFGQPSAHKHIALGYRETWELGQWIDGKTAGVVRGLTSAFDIPIDGDLAVDVKAKIPLALAIEAAGLVPGQSMTVLWNERAIAHIPLKDRWTRAVVNVPPELLTAGENRVRLHFRKTRKEAGREVAGALARVEFGRAQDLESPLKRAQVYRLQSASLGQNDVELLGPGFLAYHLLPPARAKLELELEGTGSFTVRASSDEDHQEGRPPTVLLSDVLQGDSRRAQIDLSAWGDAPVRLELAVAGQPRGAAIRLRKASIVVRREKPRSKTRRNGRDVYVLAIEGARADAFAAGHEPAMPQIEALRERALVFENAYTPAAVAISGHAAWLSSVVPPVHRTIRGTFVADRQSLLPEVLDRTDHYRVAVVGHEAIELDRGLLQGIDRSLVLGDAIGEDGTAAAIITSGLATLADRSDPAFLYAVLNDPLPPYDPPRVFRSPENPPRGAPSPHLSHLWVGRVKLHQRTPSPAEVAFVHGLYSGELLAVDQALAPLVAEVAQKEGAVLVIVGIHGQEFYEHEGAGFGRTLFEESIRVPLIIHAPGVVPAGTVAAPVDLIDLAPTLADVLGIPAPDLWQGESLLPLAEDPLPSPRLVQSYGHDDVAGIMSNRKLIVGPGRQEQYFDLAHDPGEREDKIANGGIGLRMVRNALSWQLAYERAWRRTRWGTGANLKPAFAVDQGM